MSHTITLPDASAIFETCDSPEEYAEFLNVYGDNKGIKLAAWLKQNYGVMFPGMEDSAWLNEAEALIELIPLL